jgi:hypothetical protein
MPAYSFLDTVASISGPNGFALQIGAGSGNDEGGITVEPAESKNTRKIGADGTPMKSLRAGTPGTITARFLKTSPTNAALMSAYNYQKSSSTNWGQNVITVRNTNLGDSHRGVAVAFQKAPTVTYDKDGPMLEWIFDVGNLSMKLGSGASS